MGYPKLTPVIAKGASEPRYLEDRFADVANVKNFGAKGDGVTDDTAAFEATAEAGTAFVPSGDYALSVPVAGKFFSAEDICRMMESLRSQPVFLGCRGMDCGGDFANQEEDVRTWPAVGQSCFVDPYDKIMYASNTNGVKQTRVVITKWSGIETERTFIGYTTYAYDFVSHQGLSFYRPNKYSPLLIGCCKSEYTSAQLTDYTRQQIYNFWKFDYKNPNSYSLYKSFRIIASGNHDGTAVQTTLSYDQKYLIAFYTDSSENKQVVVWKIEDIIGLDNNSDISSLWEYKFNFSTTSGGQGIFSDGNFIYFLSGTNSTVIEYCSVDGKIKSERVYGYIYSKPLSFFASYNGTTPTSIEAESESIFWASYNANVEMFVSIVHKAYNLADPASFSRYNRFYSLSIPAERAFNNAAYEPDRLASTSINDANDLVDGGITMAFSDCDNLPLSGTYYLQSLCYPVKNQNVRQIAWNTGTGVDNVFTRLITPAGEMATSWHKFVLQDENGQIKSHVGVLSDTRSPNADSTSMSMILKMQNKFEASQQNCYGYFSRYRKNVTPGSENVQTHFTLGSVENGQGSDGFRWRIYQNLATVSNAQYFFTVDNKASLGDASHRFSEVFASTDAINTSDRRKKTEISNPNDALMRAWGKVNFKVFKFLDAVESKGENARIHVGVVAQDIQEAFASEGLDAGRYGLFCYDSWEDEYEDKEVVDVEPVVDGDGNVIVPAVTHIEQVKVASSGDSYGVRYGECLALECAYQRWRLEQLEERINQLTNPNN